MTRTNRNWTYLIVTAIVRLYMLGALAISFSHIITAGHMLQLDGWQAWTTPFFIDGFAVLGMIGRSARFAEATRRTGFRLQLGAGALSFTANIFAGHTTGERLYGALVVAGFVVAEWYGAKLAPAAAQGATPTVEPTAELVDAEPAVVEPAPSRKGQPWSPERRARHEAKRAAKQAVADEIAALEDALKLASAPVSPAPGESAAYL